MHIHLLRGTLVATTTLGSSSARVSMSEESVKWNLLWSVSTFYAQDKIDPFRFYVLVYFKGYGMN